MMNLLTPAALLLAAVNASYSQELHTRQARSYLLIGMGPVNDFGGRPGVGQAVNVNNFELGANKAPVPSTSGFLTGGSSGGPSLLGNVPHIPFSAANVASGACFNGNIAVTSPRGVFNLQDVGVYGNLGIRTAASASAADAGTQNSFYNDPNRFPNTFTFGGFSDPRLSRNTRGAGVFVGPSDAVQSTRIDSPRRSGVVGGFNLNPLVSEIANSRAAINLLPATRTLDLRSRGGVIASDTLITVPVCLTVIDVLTNGTDVLLSNANLVIDGPRGARVIVRIPSNAKFNVSNGNILAGNSGIGLNSILFYSNRPDNAQHFNFCNAVLNGVAFWSVAGRGGEIAMSNVQGCTQLLAEKINLSNARFCRCAFIPDRCIADFNEDGGIDGRDVEAFFNAWENGRCNADVNDDGAIDGVDVEVFFAAYESGVC